MNWQMYITTNNGSGLLKQVRNIAVALTSTAILIGCGGSSVDGSASSGNTGPIAQRTILDADLQAFQTNLWQPVLRQYCKGCHEPNGPGTGSFANKSDLTNARNQANSRVDKTNPANSMMVNRVANGHNCWLVSGVQDCAANAAQLISAIDAWVNSDPSEGDANNADTQDPVDLVSQLSPTPPDIDPSAETLVLDVADNTQKTEFINRVYNPILSIRCNNCHSEDAIQAQRQQPYFADTDSDAAYTAIVENRKVDINTPANSRIYIRLSQESHNCWTNCTADAAEMLAALEAWKGALPINTTFVDGDNTGEEAPFSKGISLLPGQAIVVSGGTRYERNLVAKWEFKDGEADPSSTVAADTSNVLPLIDLDIVGDFTWRSGWGVQLSRTAYARAQNVEASQKIYDMIVPRNEYSFEAWVIPDNVTQEGPAVIAAYSGSNDSRNFAIGQTLYSYDVLNRNTASGVGAAQTAMGQPTLLTNPDDEDLQATQQHVVVTYDPENGRRIFINGVMTSSNGDDQDNILGGTLGEWDDTFNFSLGAEQDGTNPWAGTIRFAALYSRALSEDQVQQNYDAGVGQKFNLLFKVGHLTAAIPDETYIWFEVSEFDNYSYLFTFPRFVVLDANPTPSNFTIDIQGMRIGVNGKEAPVGQVFLHMDKSVTFPDDTAATGYYDLIGTVADVAVDGALTTVPEGPTGTIISKQNGPDLDQFYLTFKKFADIDEAVAKSAETSFPPPANVDYPDPIAGLADDNYVSGIKLFEEINATMSVVTGIPPTNTTVATVFDEIQQALPSGPALDGFLSSHQISIAKLALTYCDALVENTTLRDQFFDVGGTFEFTQPVATAFSNDTKKNIILDSLYDKTVVDNIPSQPDRADVGDILFGPTAGNLYETLTQNCPTGCDAARTRTIVKSMCVSVLSSAAATMQ